MTTRRHSTALVMGIVAAMAVPAVGEEPRWFAPDPPGLPPYTLPDPLVAADGTRVTAPEQWWSSRRAEVLELFRQHVFGRVPAAVTGAVWRVVEERDPTPARAAKWRRIEFTARRGDRSVVFHASVFTPTGAPPAPAIVMIANRTNEILSADRPTEADFWPVDTILSRGYATAAFMVREVDPDRPDGRPRGVRGLWDDDADQPDDWGTLSAWAWGASRVADALCRLPEVDGTRLAVAGHSRGGKTALWAAAQDERFGLACVNNSGCGGANILRRRFPGRETVEIINRGFPHWFNARFKTYANRENELPVDHHMLIALVAPRWVHVGSAEEDIWADPRGEFLGLVHASPVYQLLGRRGLGTDEMPPIGRPLRGDGLAYHIRAGRHNLMLEDWLAYLDTADAAFGRRRAAGR